MGAHISITAQTVEKAGATESEYGNIVVYLKTANWDQTSPFNKLCFTSNGKQALTGCVPTAYAILMQYHKWPANAEKKRYITPGPVRAYSLVTGMIGRICLTIIAAHTMKRTEKFKICEMIIWPFRFFFFFVEYGVVHLVRPFGVLSLFIN